MRPIQLGLGAFGPYLESASVDFRKLGAQELFLIHGPVGSGKTTLLDAICFALYGCSSGGERSAQDMRNDMAEENQPTTVVFDFSRGHAQYRVKRQMLGGTRKGEGSEVRSAQLWNLTGHPLPSPDVEPGIEALSTESPWDDVTRRVTELLGLGETEFRRSILIPQGQFRQLLSAPPAEREQILGAIFNTSNYKQVVPLMEMSLERQQERLRHVWQRREELAVEMQLDSGEDVLERLDQQKRSLAHLEVELLRLQQLQENFVVDAGKNAVLQERSQELVEAQKVVARLESREAEVETQRKALQRYQSASSLTDYATQLAQAEDDFEHAQVELEKAQQILTAPAGGTESTEKSVEDLKASQELHSELKTELSRVTGALGRLEAHEEACQDRDRQQLQVTQLREQLDQVEEALEESQERLKNLASSEAGPSHAERIKQLQQRIAILQRSQKRYQQQGDVRVSVERLRQYFSKAEQRCKEMEVRVSELEEDIGRLRGSKFNSQALLLVSQLQDGQPCPVCGALEHPNPAQGQAPVEEAPRGGLIDRSRERKSPERLLEQKAVQLKQAQALARKLEAERSEQAITLARLESRLEVLQDDTLEAPPEEPATDTLAQLSEELRLLERDAASRGKEDNEKLRVQQRAQKLTRTASDLRTAFREAEVRLAQQETLVQERQRQLVAGLETRDKIEHNRKQILNDLELVAQEMQGGQSQIIQSTGELAARQAAFQAAERGLEMAKERLRLAREIFEARSEAAGFSSIEDVADSLTSYGGSPKDEHSLLHKHQVDLEAARSRLERASRLFNESQEDAGGVLDLETLKQRLNGLVEQKSSCQSQIQELQSRSEEYQHCIEEINHLEPQLAQTKKLLRVAQGDNRAKVSFQQYLLAQHMENVLLAANHRLAWMTRGRYSLQAVGKGLELEVRDHLSGQLRPVATLSGGESFLASLGLALGLSDSLAYGGAASAMEALFIDEGFGNLDEEALELALQGLMQLQHEGRLVGVVSHLPALRERIHARLEVQSGPTGSRAQVFTHR